MNYSFALLLLGPLAACRTKPADPPAPPDYLAAPAPYLVLAQKAITY